MNKQLTTKTCTRCQVEKPIEDFYAPNRSRCKECEKAQKREYHSSFRGKAAQALQDSRRAVRKVEREQGNKVVDTLTLFEVLMTFNTDECAYCEREVPEHKRTLDHITPMKYGGGNTFENVTMACMDCNRDKSDIPVILHYIRKEIEADQVVRLIDKIAMRSGRTFKEVYEQLVEDVITYFDVKTAEALERIESEESA